MFQNKNLSFSHWRTIQWLPNPYRLIHYSQILYYRLWVLHDLPLSYISPVSGMHLANSKVRVFADLKSLAWNICVSSLCMADSFPSFGFQLRVPNQQSLPGPLLQSSTPKPPIFSSALCISFRSLSVLKFQFIYFHFLIMSSAFLKVGIWFALFTAVKLNFDMVSVYRGCMTMAKVTYKLGTNMPPFYRWRNWGTVKWNIFFRAPDLLRDENAICFILIERMNEALFV